VNVSIQHSGYNYSIAAILGFLLLAATLCLPKTRLWDFKTPFSLGQNQLCLHCSRPEKFIGQVGTSFVPGIGQVADIRDLSAAFNAGRTEGWNIRTSVGVMAAGLAFVPLLSDVAKAGVKPLVRDKVLGPRSDYAKIDILCEPAERFEVKFDLPNLQEAQEYGYLDWAILGILDVLMTEQTYPLRKMYVLRSRAQKSILYMLIGWLSVMLDEPLQKNFLKRSSLDSAVVFQPAAGRKSPPRAFYI
jgi:hypothetical protein